MKLHHISICYLQPWKTISMVDYDEEGRLMFFSNYYLCNDETNLYLNVNIIMYHTMHYIEENKFFNNNSPRHRRRNNILPSCFLPHLHRRNHVFCYELKI